MGSHGIRCRAVAWRSASFPGRRTVEQTQAVVTKVYQRTEGRPSRLMTGDDDPAYQDAIRHLHGTEVTTTPTGRDSHRMVPEKVPPLELTYATVEQKRRQRRMVEILVHLIFGTMTALGRALRRSKVSRRVNVSFLERYHATDRHRNARKVRRTTTPVRSLENALNGCAQSKKLWRSGRVPDGRNCLDHNRIRPLTVASIPGGRRKALSRVRPYHFTVGPVCGRMIFLQGSIDAGRSQAWPGAVTSARLGDRRSRQDFRIIADESLYLLMRTSFTSTCTSTPRWSCPTTATRSCTSSSR